MNYRITKEVYKSGRVRFCVECFCNHLWTYDRGFDTYDFAEKYLNSLIEVRNDLVPLSVTVVHKVTI